MNIVWITWEDHRRSRELANHLNISYFCSRKYDNYLFKIVVNCFWTLKVLIKERPSVCIVQNPSMMLNFFVIVLRGLFRFKIVADRHSNFKFETMNSSSLKFMIFHWLSRFVCKYSDLMIVTNDYLKNIVESWGGNALVLPDPFPFFKEGDFGEFNLRDSKNIIFICSFGSDEPIDEINRAAKILQDDSFRFYLTGNPEKVKNVQWENNITLTGFLKYSDYLDLLRKGDVIVVLTTKDHLLLCGAYEAIALRKAIILSKTKSLQNYFQDGAIYSENDAKELSRNIKETYNNKSLIEERVTRAYNELSDNWINYFDPLKQYLGLA